MSKIAPLAILSVFLATAGQLFLKAGMDKVGYIDGDRLKRPIQLVATIGSKPQVIAGLALFVLSATSWLLVLSRVPLSVAYPFVGLTYVLTALFSKFILRESVPALRWLGIVLVLGGIALVGRSSPVDQTKAHETTSAHRATVPKT